MKNYTTFEAALGLVALVSASENKGMTELTDIDTLHTEMNKYEFSILSMYTSSDLDLEVDTYMEGAMKIFNEKMANGKMSHRDVGWFRADIEKYPELDLQTAGIGDQAIISRDHNLTRFLHWNAGDDIADEEREEHYFDVLNQLSGDFYQEIACDQMQVDDRVFYDEVVYMGQPGDLKKGEYYADMFESLSLFDKYNFDQQKVGFFWNNDPECKKEFGLDEEERYLLMLNGINSIENHFHFEPLTYYSAETLMMEVNVQVCKGTPRWSQRASSVVFEHQVPALVLMMQEDYFESDWEQNRDWRVALFSKMTDWIQEHERDFIPIIAHDDTRADEEAQAYVWSLTQVIDMDTFTLPHIYFIDPTTHEAMPYPEKLDDLEKVSPELIIAWADLVRHQTEMDRLMKDIKEADQDEDSATDPENRLTAEEKSEYKENLLARKRELTDEISIYKEEYATVQEEMSTHGNEFAKTHEEYFDMAELHLSRIGQIMMDEL